MGLDRPVVVLDLETTGKNPREDRVVEMAATRVELDWSVSDHFDVLINPGIPIPPEATKIHGITDEMVQTQGSPFGAAVTNLYLMTMRPGAEAALGGYNAIGFDVPLLIRECERAGVDAGFLRGRPIVDPCALFKLCEARDLQSAVNFYCGDYIGVPQPTHRAGDDVRATIAVMRAQLDGRYPFLPDTAEGLWNLARGRQADWFDEDGTFSKQDGQLIFNRGKWVGKSLSYVRATDPGYLRWMLGKDFNRDVKQVVWEVLRDPSKPAAS